ncbi:MAG: hypothetical protein EXS36_12645 [Pedosphaera sp.]|nr:hypothetical protein [Pedosphaera sp.]
MKSLNWRRLISGCSFFHGCRVAHADLRVRAGISFFIVFGWLVASAQAAEVDASQPPDFETFESLQDLFKAEVPKVFGASRREEESTRAPAAVTVVKADEINKFGYRTWADLLMSVRGLHVSYDRNYSLLGVRGFNRGDYNSRVLVLIDGHRINNNLTDGAPIGTDFPLGIDLVEQVEIIRGPSAVLYGNNAFFGVINVVTRKGHLMEGHGTEVSGEVATFDTYKGRVTYGKQFTNGLEIMLSGSLYDSEGHDHLFYKEFNSPTSNNGIAQDADRDNFKSLFSTVSYKDFSLQGAFITREKHNPTALYGTAFKNPRFRTVDDRSYVNLTYKHEAPDIIDVDAKLSYDRYELTRDQPIDPTLPLTTDKQAGEWWGAELQLNKTLWKNCV